MCTGSQHKLAPSRPRVHICYHGFSSCSQAHQRMAPLLSHPLLRKKQPPKSTGLKQLVIPHHLVGLEMVLLLHGDDGCQSCCHPVPSSMKCHHPLGFSCGLSPRERRGGWIPKEWTQKQASLRCHFCGSLLVSMSHRASSDSRRKGNKPHRGQEQWKCTGSERLPGGLFVDKLSGSQDLLLSPTRCLSQTPTQPV